MLIDRLDWIGGWPVVRAGAGPSEGDRPGPMTSWAVGGTFNNGSLAGWRTAGTAPNGWSIGNEQDAREYAPHPGSGGGAAYLISAGTAPTNLRAEADLRATSGAAGLTIGYAGRGWTGTAAHW